MLKTGLFYLFETLGEVPENRFYKDSLEEVIYGDELGFFAVSPAEHHFSKHYGIMPRVELFLSWVSGRTRNIRLWPMVIIAPFENPIRLAEDIALLDNFSDGRVVFSIGTGYRAYEYEGLGLDIKVNWKVLRETAEVCVKLWTQNDVIYDGEFVKIRKPVSIEPKPYQKPHPPVFITTTRDDTTKWCAERGFGIVPAAAFAPHEFKHSYKVWEENLKNGEPIVGGEKIRAFFKWIYVDESDKRAREIAQEFFTKTLLAFSVGGEFLLKLMSDKLIETWPKDKPMPKYSVDNPIEMIENMMDNPELTAIVWGDPERVKDTLSLFTKNGANYFIGGFKLGPISPDMVKKSMKLYIEKVAPYL